MEGIMTRVFSSMLVLVLSGCVSYRKVSYLDRNYPSLEPRIYAPEILSLSDRNEHGLTIRDHGEEHIFGLDGQNDWTYDGLACLKRGEDGSLSLECLHFADNIERRNHGIIAGEPCLSPDGKSLFFVADHPTDIWKVSIGENGSWGRPVKLDAIVNSDGSEWFPHVAQDGCLYFARDTDGHVSIHKAESVDGQYKTVSKFEAAFNFDCGDQVFSQDMDYVIFTSPRAGGYGNIDLYIAFKDENGEWTDAINMGPAMNTEGFEMAPYISPDQKFLFFTRRQEMNGQASSDIYWVSLDIVSELRNKVRSATGGL